MKNKNKAIIITLSATLAFLLLCAAVCAVAFFKPGGFADALPEIQGGEIVVTVIQPDGTVNKMPAAPGLFTFPTCNYSEPGRSFLGWRVNGEDALYDEGDSMLMLEDTMISAVFGKKMHTLTLEYGNGKSESFTCDEFILPTVVSSDPAFSFVGWAESFNGQAAHKANDTIIISKNKTLYAVYTERSYTVTFVSGSNTAEIACKYGEELNVSDYGFAKAKHVMTGYTDQNNHFYPLGSKVVVREDLELTACYELSRTFHVSINDNIDRSGLYRINVRDYIDLDQLVRQGATHIRLSWTQSSARIKGNCISAVDIYVAAPEKNRNTFVMDHKYQVATYTNDNKIFATDFEDGTHSFSTEYIEIAEVSDDGYIFIFYKALASGYLDIARNCYQLSADFTIEVK